MKMQWNHSIPSLLLFVITTTVSNAYAAIEISTKATQHISCAAGVCSPTAKKAVLNVNDLASMLASGDVTVKSNSLAQDVDIDAALSWSSLSALVLDSYHDIAFKRPMTVAGPGALTIITSDGTSDGDFVFSGKGHVEFWDKTSRLDINGEDYSLVTSMQGLIQAAARSELPIALAKNIDAGRHGTYDRAPVPELQHTLEGLGNAISNLSIVSSTPNASLALIATCQCVSASVRDLTLTSVNVQGTGAQQALAPLIELLNFGVVKDISVTGSLSATGDGSIAAGLLAVSNGGTLTQTHSDASVSNLNGALVGGLVARYVGAHMIEKSFATGTVTGGDGSIVGGLVADVDNGLVLNSYATGSVQAGRSALIGGLIGKNEDAQGPTQILTSYSTGLVSRSNDATSGGLIGQDLASGGISNAYWNLDTSGISNRHRGAGNPPNDPGITGLTDAELRSGLPAGFDPSVWGDSPGINNGWPYIKSNPPSR